MIRPDIDQVKLYDKIGCSDHECACFAEMVVSGDGDWVPAIDYIELVRYVQILEKALQIYDSLAKLNIVTMPEYCMDKAERELFPEAQP